MLEACAVFNGDHIVEERSGRYCADSPSGTTWIVASRTSSRKRFNVDPFIRISHRVRAV